MTHRFPWSCKLVTSVYATVAALNNAVIKCVFYCMIKYTPRELDSRTKAYINYSYFIMPIALKNRTAKGQEQTLIQAISNNNTRTQKP
jgi:hypothetical protein